VVNPFNWQEIEKLLFIAEGQIKNIFQVAFFTGLRPSELIGLRWEDVNWEPGSLSVKRAVVGGIEKDTKTKVSIREITLLLSVWQALKVQQKYTLAFGR